MSNHKARCEKTPIYSSVMDQQNNKLTLILKDFLCSTALTSAGWVRMTIKLS